VSTKKKQGAGVAVASEGSEVKVVPKSKTVTVDITAPVFEHGSVMLRHAEFKMTPRQSRALRLLFDGLVAEGETIRLAGPQPEKITSQHDAVRWVLDRIADSTGIA
jgi:DNA-binding GntR family transcriptional regulator